MVLSSLTHAKSNGSSLFTVLSLDILQSLDEDKIEALKSINLTSIGDLLHCKFFHTAQLLMAISRKEIGHDFALEKFLDTSYQSKKPSELPDLPLIAIAGIGEITESVFNKVFGITTIRELAIFPPFLEAQEYLTPDREVFNEPASAPEDLMPKIIGSTHSIARFNNYIKDEELKLDLGLYSNIHLEESQDLNQELYDIFSTSNARLFLGYIAGFKQKWENMGTHLGEVIHSLALAPGESRNIAMIEWYRRQSSKRDENTLVDEKLTNNLVHSRALNEVVKSTAQEHLYGRTDIKATTKTSGFGITAGAGGGTSSGASASGDLTSIIGFPLQVAGALLSSMAGSIGASAVFSENEQVGRVESTSKGFREVLGNIQQNITDSTVQNSSNIRSLYSTVVVTDSQAEKEEIQTRNVTNYNHSHALTIQYYEVLQKYNIVMELESWQPVVFLPFRPIHFAMPVIQKYWHLFSKLFVKTFPELYERYNHVIKNYQVNDGGFNPNSEDVSVLTLRITTSGDFPPYTYYTIGSSKYQKTIAVDNWLELRIKSSQNANRIFAHNFSKNQSVIKVDTALDYLSDLELFWIQSEPTLNPPDLNVRTTINCLLEFELQDLQKSNGKKLTVQKSYSAQITYEALYDSAIKKTPVISLSGLLPQDIRAVVNAITGWSPFEITKEIENHFNQYKYGYTRFLLIAIESDQLIDIAESLFFKNIENGLPRKKILGLAQAPQSSDFPRTIEKIKDTPSDKEIKKELTDYLYPLPIAITENYLIFKTKKPKESEKSDLIWSYLSYLNKNLEAYKEDRSTKVQDTVFLPTAGVFAEAILGRSNASEFVDPRRFWDWQDSPIPNLAPQLAMIEAGKHVSQNQSGNLQPNVPVSNLNIVTPPQFPMPTSLNSALQAVQNGNMFRDMAKAGELGSVLSSLANLASTTAQLVGNLSGEAAENALYGALELGKQVAGMVNQASKNNTNSNMAPPPLTSTQKAAALNALEYTFQNGEASTAKDEAVAELFGVSVGSGKEREQLETIKKAKEDGLIDEQQASGLAFGILGGLLQMILGASPVIEKEPKISFGPNANQTSINEHVMKIIKGILKEAKEKDVTITSTTRTVEDQARIMYDNLTKDGIASQRKLYKEAGNKIIDVYEKLKKEKKSRDEIIPEMVKEINKVGPSKVSNHIGDPSKLLAVDIDPSTIKNKKEFINAVEAAVKAGSVKKFIQPPNDPAYHLEIPPK